MTPKIKTRLWNETPDTRSPFLGRDIRIAGFDYFGDLLGNAQWTDLVWLLMTTEPPTPDQRRLFADLAVALAHPGPRDPAIHAAMCAGVGGSAPAAALMAALAVGAGEHGGSAELVRAMQAWQSADDIANNAALASCFTAKADEHGTWPGFTPMTPHSAQGVIQCLDYLCASPLAHRLERLRTRHAALSATCGGGLTLTGVAAAAFADLGLSPAQADAIHLLLRLPCALAHALEQSGHSYRDFPFFSLSERAAAESGS